MSRKFFIAANWKMHSIPKGALAAGSPYYPHNAVDIAVFPTLLDLKDVQSAGILCGPQCAHPDDSGAHTGDISMKMIADIGCPYVLCGHSERRTHHAETDDQIAAQVESAIAHGLHPIVCIGETAAERDAGQEEAVVQAQLLSIIHYPLSIAYEPVWAIGTGNTATPEQAQAMHAFIRSLLPDKRRSVTRILYGGSMKPENAADLLSQTDIDGGLIGGASLKPDAFKEIVEIAQQCS